MGEYFYKTAEIENYAQLPLDFVKSAFYADLNLGVKMLYTVLLDRLGLSAKNEWVDANGRIYIVYTEEKMEEDLHVSRSSIKRYMRELEKWGLIEKDRRGLGLPNRIFVKNFMNAAVMEEIRERKEKNKSKSEESGEDGIIDGEELIGNGEKVNLNLQDEGETGTTSEGNLNLQCENKDESDTTGEGNLNFLESSESSPNQLVPIQLTSITSISNRIMLDEMDEERKAKKIFESLGMEQLLQERPDDKKLLYEIYNLVLEIILNQTQNTFRVKKENMLAEKVKERFWRLNADHVLYVIECIRRQEAGTIKKPKAYLLTSLYDAPETIGTYRSAGKDPKVQRKNGFINYEQPERDWEAIYALEREHNERLEKGRESSRELDEAFQKILARASGNW